MIYAGQVLTIPFLDSTTEASVAEKEPVATATPTTEAPAETTASAATPTAEIQAPTASPVEEPAPATQASTGSMSAEDAISTYMEDMWIGYIPAPQMDTYDIPHSIYPAQPIGCYRDIDGTTHIFQDGK